MLRHYCDRCGESYCSERCLGAVFPDIPELLKRIEPGDIVPSGTCPACGALVYREDDSFMAQVPPRIKDSEDEMGDRL